MNAKEEKERQAESWNVRNCHVIEMEDEALGIVRDLILIHKFPKHDIILLGELILDIGKRLD